MSTPKRAKPQGVQAIAQFQSSLSYCEVHDFAYPDFHPLHYGAVGKEPKKTGRPDDEEHNDDHEHHDRDDADDSSDQHAEDGPPWEQDSDLASPVMHSRNVGDRISREYEFSVSSIDEIHGRAVALFDFVPENDNEAPLKAGQIVWVSYRHGQGWLVAEDPHTGETGLVPEEYVQMLNASDIYHSPEQHGSENEWVDEEDDTTQATAPGMGTNDNENDNDNHDNDNHDHDHDNDNDHDNHNHDHDNDNTEIDKQLHEIDLGSRSPPRDS